MHSHSSTRSDDIDVLNTGSCDTSDRLDFCFDNVDDIDVVNAVCGY